VGTPLNGVLSDVGKSAGSLVGYFEAVHTRGPNDIKNQPGPGYHNQTGVGAGNKLWRYMHIWYLLLPVRRWSCTDGKRQPEFYGTLATGFDTPSDNASIRQGQIMRASECHE
jgi:hypothetical protein